MEFIEQIFVPATLEEAVNLAAKHLPENYRIQITLERAGYDFSLIAPDGTETCISGDDCLKTHIIDHVNLALEQAGAEG